MSSRTIDASRVDDARTSAACPPGLPRGTRTPFRRGRAGPERPSPRQAVRASRCRRAYTGTGSARGRRTRRLSCQTPTAADRTPPPSARAGEPSHRSSQPSKPRRAGRGSTSRSCPRRNRGSRPATTRAGRSTRPGRRRRRGHLRTTHPQPHPRPIAACRPRACPGGPTLASRRAIRPGQGGGLRRSRGPRRALSARRPARGLAGRAGPRRSGSRQPYCRGGPPGRTQSGDARDRGSGRRASASRQARRASADVACR